MSDTVVSVYTPLTPISSAEEEPRGLGLRLG